MHPKTLLLGLDGIPAVQFNGLYDGGELPHLRAAFEGGLRVRRLVSAFPTDSMTCMPLMFQGRSVADLDPLAQLCYNRSTERYLFAWDLLPFLRGSGRSFRSSPVSSTERDGRPDLSGSLPAACPEHNRRLALSLPKGEAGPSACLVPRTGPAHGSRRTLIIGIKEIKDAGVYIPPFYFLCGAFLTPLAPRFDTLVLRALPHLLSHFDVIAYWTASCDHAAHSYGQQGLANALRRFDREFGRLIKVLPQETTLLLFSDHGSAPVRATFDLGQVLRQHGYRVVRRPAGERDVVLCDSLLNYVFVYTPDDPTRLADALRQRPEVGLCAFREIGKGTVVVANRQGRAEISARADRYRYVPLEGDPLGYGMAQPIELSAGEWLASTIESRYPYGVVRLWQVFQNRQCGDLVLSFDNGYSPQWSFTVGGRLKVRAPLLQFRHNHGGMEREQLLTIMLARGAGIASETRDYALIEEAFPIWQRQLAL